MASGTVFGVGAATGSDGNVISGLAAEKKGTDAAIFPKGGSERGEAGAAVSVAEGTDKPSIPGGAMGEIQNVPVKRAAARSVTSGRIDQVKNVLSGNQGGKRRGNMKEENLGGAEGKRRLVGRSGGNDKREQMNVEGGGRDIPTSNLYQSAVKDVVKQSGGKSYAQMVKQGNGNAKTPVLQDEAGQSSRNRRNLVRISYGGEEGVTYTRKTFIQLLMKMGFRVVDFYAILTPETPPSYFDVSFLSPTGLDTFWEKYESTWKSSEEWKGLFPQTVSRQSLDKKVTIVVPNESIPVHDLMVWIKNYGVHLNAPKKVMDEFRIWEGGWELMVRLNKVGNVVKHIPTSVFIGRDRVAVFYQGQPRVCHKCNSRSHYSISCPEQKCSRCHELGHLAKDCKLIRCSICLKLGHPYSQCPESWSNMEEEIHKEMEKIMVEEGIEAASGGGSPQSES
ncbi:zinc finger CCHC domain-containing protein 3-like [Hyperolius riggenbachi]|uniref:zinc finger CCHC domain-containing protein 3-like n=1 Tax=Hyperolius riggenbachi TaxID=752182 RepID=UPI0035A3C754